MAVTASSFLLPVPRDRRRARAGRLLAGLIAYGVSIGCLVQAGLGLAPWAVLDQGLARSLGGAIGTWSIATGALVLLLWIPLRERPGVGTVANVVVVGLSLDVTVWLLPAPAQLWLRILLAAVGVVGNALATALYVGAGLGPGPRDGLMTGLAGRGHPVRVVRTGIEATVLLAGWALGGQIGWATLGYALAIGPLVHVLLPVLTVRADVGQAPAGASASTRRSTNTADSTPAAIAATPATSTARPNPADSAAGSR